IDISPIQRPHSLSNLTFRQLDAETEGLPDQQYDYIFLRYIISCFDSTQSVFRRVFEHLAPGGWIEIYDVCQGYMPVGRPFLRGTALDKWSVLVEEGGRRVGRDLTRSRCYAGWLQEVGFVNVTEMRFGLPCYVNVNANTKAGANKRMQKVSELSMKNEMKLVDSLGGFLRNAVADEDEARVLEEGARRDLENPDMPVLKEIYKPIDA
ncbi:hypothetical protein E4U55_005751, partial [Claviceps digitariae]